MRVGTHGRSLALSSIPSVHRILATMRRLGMVPVVDAALAEQLGQAGLPLDADVEVATDVMAARVDMFLSLGGDGTFLETVAKVGHSGVPILGINLGRLGFLSNTREEGAELALRAVMARDYTIEERGLLELVGEGPLHGPLLALNEVSLHKRDSSSMISVHAYVGDRFLNTYWADGLIIATPTGSTAYSLSCGGPLLDPRCDAIVITPIAPHNLNVRPFVLPGESVIRLRADVRGDKYLVNLDQRSFSIDHPMDLHVQRARHRVRLIHLPDQDFFNTLRVKLAWGLDARSAPPEDDK